MRCENCNECTYIGEGDFICTKDLPKIVIVDFCISTEDYRWCKRRLKIKLSKKLIKR